ncbi:MAG: hypothetical protein JRI39_12155 [Deltaproteobacteria bacterium]|nr:hypothetical protein [Deltaproteobacteria bacterium]
MSSDVKLESLDGLIRQTYGGQAFPNISLGSKQSERIPVRTQTGINYFGISEYYRPSVEIDHWLRRRVHMCYWKQWRYTRTKVRKLRNLGTSLYAAISVAISRKGPWHLARTLATQTGITKWLKDPCLLQAGTRMQGGVGAGVARPPVTRLCFIFQPIRPEGITG